MNAMTLNILSIEVAVADIVDIKDKYIISEAWRWLVNASWNLYPKPY